CRKTSVTRFVSCAIRLSALLSKTTKRPSAESDGFPERLSASTPADDTLTRTIAPVTRSWTKMSVESFVSPGTRSSAPVSNATQRPSAESAGNIAYPSDSAPLASTLARAIGCCARAAPANDADATASRRAAEAGRGFAVTGGPPDQFGSDRCGAAAEGDSATSVPERPLEAGREGDAGARAGIELERLQVDHEAAQRGVERNGEREREAGWRDRQDDEERRVDQQRPARARRN